MDNGLRSILCAHSIVVVSDCKTKVCETVIRLSKHIFNSVVKMISNWFHYFHTQNKKKTFWLYSKHIYVVFLFQLLFVVVVDIFLTFTLLSNGTNVYFLLQMEKKFKNYYQNCFVHQIMAWF